MGYNTSWFLLYTPGTKAEADQLSFDFIATTPMERKKHAQELLPKPARSPKPGPEATPLPIELPPTPPTDIAQPDAPDTLARFFYQHWSKSGPHALLTAGDRALAEELLRSHSMDEAKAIVLLCITHARATYPNLVTFGGARSLIGIAIASHQEKQADRDPTRQRQQARTLQQTLQAAQEAHRARFTPAYTQYLSQLKTTLSEANPALGEAYTTHRATERARVCKPLPRPDGPIAKSLLSAFDSPDQEANRLRTFFKTNWCYIPRPKLVPDFWEWDTTQHPDPFQKENTV